MYPREDKPRRPKSRKSRTPLIRMDPDCAICGGAANLRCDCESKALEKAITYAEQRMMQSIYDDIRDWARGHAQDYILSYFTMLSERRKVAHSEHLERIQHAAFYQYRAPPHPSEIAHAQQMLKRGIDEDWQASVQRYPEVLEYFFGLVDVTFPRDDEPCLKDPPLSALSGSRKPGRVTTAPATIASGPFHPPPEPMPPRARPPRVLPPRDRDRITPPPPPTTGRRTPGPPARADRRSLRPPPPPTTYYGGPQGPPW